MFEINTCKLQFVFAYANYRKMLAAKDRFDEHSFSNFPCLFAFDLDI